MADLKCVAENCSYNEEHMCSKGDILVGGKHADSVAETFCESFMERPDSKATKNSTCHPSKTISIDCEATNCNSNSNYRCTADHVNIEGGNAHECHQTACGSFCEA